MSEESPKLDDAADETKTKRRPGALDLSLLMKVKDTVLVPSTESTEDDEVKSKDESEAKEDDKTEDKTEKKEDKKIELHCVNWKILNREARIIEPKKKSNNFNRDRNRRQDNDH